MGRKFALSSKESFLWCGAISPLFQVSGTSDFAMIVLKSLLSGLAILKVDALTARDEIES